MPANVPSDKNPWLPIHPNYKDVNVNVQKNLERSHLKFYEKN